MIYVYLYLFAGFLYLWHDTFNHGVELSLKRDMKRSMVAVLLWPRELWRDIRVWRSIRNYDREGDDV